MVTSERDTSDVVNNKHNSKSLFDQLREGLLGLLFLIALVALPAILIWAVAIPDKVWFSTLAAEHFRAMVIVPVAALVSLVIVWAFGVVQGPIEVSGTGLFSFKGAASHLAFWLLVFLAIVTAVNMSW